MNMVQKFKQKIREGKVNTGVGVSLTDPTVCELFAEVGYDYVWIEMEHSTLTLETALNHIMVLNGTDTAALVRVPCCDMNVIKPVLDMSPAGIIVPQIQTAQEAADVVSACKYPPVGQRGFGPRRGMRYGAVSMADYLVSADKQTMVIVQIEHIKAVCDLDTILATPGLDGICIGPNDLSGSMGKLGQTSDPEVLEAIDTVIEKVKQTDLLLGVATGYSPETLAMWLNKGIQWICLNGDCANLYLYSKMIVDAVAEAQTHPAKTCYGEEQ